MATAYVRGVNLHYETFGHDGPPLVVAHGLMGSIALSALFADPIESIATRGVRVVAYDARGHGKSGYTSDARDYTWYALAEDMYAFIRALGPERASVCGGSMGAGTAMVLALEHPDVVDKLILRAPPPFGDDMKKVQPGFAALAIMFRVLGPSLTARLLGSMPQFRGDEGGIDAHTFFGSQRRASIVPAINGVVFGDPLPWHRLDRITHPTLIMTHPDDPLHPLASGELLHDRLAHARLAVAPSSSYWRENSDALAHVIAAFVKGEEVAQGLPQKLVHAH